MSTQRDPLELDRFASRLLSRFEAARIVRYSGTRLDVVDPEDSVVIWEIPGGVLDDALVGARKTLQQAPSTMVVVTEPIQRSVPDLATLFAAAGRPPTFVGTAPALAGRPGLPMAVFTGGRYPEARPAPDDFKVAAIMAAYNEADIIRPSIEGLIAQGIDVYLTDNWSTDGTPELVEDLVGKGLLAIERFPEGGRPDTYEWERLLRHTAEVAQSLDHDWCVHHDVDQRRDGPWPDLSYRDALWVAQQWGFNAIDHTILEFRPTDDSFQAGGEVSKYLTHFELVPEARNAIHVQAWKNDQAVDLVRTGGHEVAFPGRRVFPFNFTLRHYPVRSQAHGDKKVFSERAPRYRPEELRKGWHHHYAKLKPGHEFVREQQSLISYRPDSFNEDFLVQRLAQSGFALESHAATGRAKRRAASALHRVGLLSPTSKLLHRIRLRRGTAR